MIERRRHERYRELMSARLDGQLSVLAERQLIRHLLSCAECRAVQNDYFEQRRQLRALPPVQPPRDLWARTSAALDREVARQPWLPRRTRRLLLPRLALTGSALALGLALVLSSSEVQIQPQPEEARVSPPVALLPTPFGVAPQRMTLVGAGISGIVLYRAELDQVCPTSALACLDEEALAPQVISLPRGVSAGDFSVSPDGQHLAMTGTLSGRSGIFAVVLDDEPSIEEPPAAPDTPRPDTPLPDTPLPDTPEPDTPQPHTTTNSDTPVPVTDSAGPTVAATPDETTTTATPAVTTSTASPPETSAPAVETSAPTTPAASDPPEVDPSPTAAALAAVTILADVEMAGAAPAWSPSGDVLAFSAVPADGSHGPDIYLWREGEAMAEPLTDDHGTYFASWAEGRIVASRIVAGDDEGSLSLRTVVIDLETGEERTVRAPDIWLPQVSPLGGEAVVWNGSLSLSRTRAEPEAGALYLADWSALDPFARDAEPGLDPSPEAAAEPSLEPATEEQLDPADPGSETSPAAQPMITLPPADEHSPSPRRNSSPDPQASSIPSEARDPSESHKPSDNPDPSASAEPAAATEEPAASASEELPDRAQIGLLPLEPERDPLEDPVLDWQARWSKDGAVVGYWVADSSGASWGQLVVRPVLAGEGVLSVGEPVLGPTLSRRSFTLGINRVAWVGATDEQPEGEVRIRTWGPGGEGGLRLPILDLREVVPAF